MSYFPNAISIANFSFTYAETKKPALTNINLDIAPGELIILAGKSGCGKSTLLRSLNGIIPNLLPGKTEGTISIFGQSITDMPPEAISEFAGSVFQNPRSQFFHINVTDEVAFGPESLGLSKKEIVQRVDEAFDLFAINHLRDRKMYELSSGEQQKVSFAAIYATGSDIFFLDEPSANLDFQAIKNLERILGMLKAKGKTIVAAEHRLYYLASLFDKMVIVNDGQVDAVLPRDAACGNNLTQTHGLRALDLKAFIKSVDQLPYETGARDGSPNLTSQNLCFTYRKRGKKILNDISLNFRQGEKIAIIGPNGSGKTTLTKLIAGLLKPSSGAFLDNSGKKQSCSQRLQTCGLVLQENSHQLFYSSVQEELDSASPNGIQESSPELLCALGLAHLKDTHPQNLSAGQQQRLVFAIAAINSPRILILDEPTSGLDADSMRAMGNKINAESQKGSTVVIVTHDFEFISYYCDTALLLRDGHVIQRIDRKNFKSELPLS